MPAGVPRQSRPPDSTAKVDSRSRPPELTAREMIGSPPQEPRPQDPRKLSETCISYGRALGPQSSDFDDALHCSSLVSDWFQYDESGPNQFGRPVELGRIRADSCNFHRLRPILALSQPVSGRTRPTSSELGPQSAKFSRQIVCRVRPLLAKVGPASTKLWKNNGWEMKTDHPGKRLANAHLGSGWSTAAAGRIWPKWRIWARIDQFCGFGQVWPPQWAEMGQRSLAWITSQRVQPNLRRFRPKSARSRHASTGFR